MLVAEKSYTKLYVRPRNGLERTNFAREVPAVSQDEFPKALKETKRENGEITTGPHMEAGPSAYYLLGSPWNITNLLMGYL